jgi:hypothetical protein
MEVSTSSKQKYPFCARDIVAFFVNITMYIVFTTLRKEGSNTQIMKLFLCNNSIKNNNKLGMRI